MAAGFGRVWPEAEYVRLPVADGGEGTLHTLVSATNGRLFRESVSPPLGVGTINALWGMLGDGETAVVELAQAAGLTLIPPEQRDVKNAHTHGVGELIRAALQHPQTKRLIVGLGGSATNDGGSGILRALGIEMTNADGEPLPLGGAALSALHALGNSASVRASLPPIPIQIACDVDNPLCGVRGASAIFGTQKGATPDGIALLDAALLHYASILAANGHDVAHIPGSGAAGGAAAGLLWFFPRAVLSPGIEIVLDAVRFDDAVRGADLVVTGEGRLDAQTFGGKVVAGVARRAAKQGVPTVALAGAIDADATANAVRGIGVTAAMPILPAPVSLNEALTNARPWLADAAERAALWLKAGMALRRDS